MKPKVEGEFVMMTREDRARLDQIMSAERRRADLETGETADRRIVLIWLNVTSRIIWPGDTHLN